MLKANTLCNIAIANGAALEIIRPRGRVQLDKWIVLNVDSEDIQIVQEFLFLDHCRKYSLWVHGIQSEDYYKVGCYFQVMELAMEYFKHNGEMSSTFRPARGNLSRSDYEAMMIILKRASNEHLVHPIFWKVDKKRLGKVLHVENNYIKHRLQDVLIREEFRRGIFNDDQYKKTLPVMKMVQDRRLHDYEVKQREQKERDSMGMEDVNMNNEKKIEAKFFKTVLKEEEYVITDLRFEHLIPDPLVEKIKGLNPEGTKEVRLIKMGYLHPLTSRMLVHLRNRKNKCIEEGIAFDVGEGFKAWGRAPIKRPMHAAPMGRKKFDKDRDLYNLYNMLKVEELEDIQKGIAKGEVKDVVKYEFKEKTKEIQVAVITRKHLEENWTHQQYTRKRVLPPISPIKYVEKEGRVRNPDRITKEDVGRAAAEKWQETANLKMKEIITKGVEMTNILNKIHDGGASPFSCKYKCQGPVNIRLVSIRKTLERAEKARWWIKGSVKRDKLKLKEEKVQKTLVNPAREIPKHMKYVSENFSMRMALYTMSLTGLSRRTTLMSHADMRYCMSALAQNKPYSTFYKKGHSLDHRERTVASMLMKNAIEIER